MSDGFACPKCEMQYSISDLELFEVYEEDGKETPFKCFECNTEMTITSEVVGWTFNVEELEA